MGQRPVQPRRAPSNSKAVIHRIERELSVAEIWRIVVKRRRTFYTCVAAMVAIAVLACIVLPTRYQCVSRLTLDFDSNALRDSIAAVSGGIDANDIRLQTQIKVLESDALAWDLIRRLRLDQRPEAAHRILEIGPTRCVSPANLPFDSISLECRGVILKEFHRLFRVESLPRTQVVEIRYRCGSPDLAAKVVNTAEAIFEETEFEAKYKSTERVSSWIASQLDEARKNAEDSEQKLIAYQKQTGIVGTDQNHNVLTEQLSSVSQQLVGAEANRIVREARYRVSQTGDPEALVDMTPGGPLQLMHTQQIAAQTQYSQLNSRFGENYPRVIEAKSALDDANKHLSAEIARSDDRIKSEYDASVRSEESLRQQFENLKSQVFGTAETSTRLALLKGDVEASQELYTQLVKQLNEAGILSALRAARTSVIDPAVAPYEPIEPHYGLTLVLGLLGGALLGVGFCLLRENLDTKILTLRDARSASAVPVLGVIPHLGAEKGAGKGRTADSDWLAALEKRDGFAEDAFRSVRTSLLLSNPGAAPVVVMTTSALPREGKTILSCSLGVAFARRDARVLLVDADLRKAGLSRALGVFGEGGLSAALAGEDPSRFYMTHDRLAGLTILPAGHRPPQPPDLLDSERMRQLIAQWRHEFDRVIIDAPPVIGMSDAVILSTMADATMVVLRANLTQRKELTLALEILAGVNTHVAGTIVNDYRGAISDAYDATSDSEGYFELR